MVWRQCKRRSGKDGVETRTVWVHREPPPASADDTQQQSDDATAAPATLPRYTDNSITTAKYTLITFLPKNLFQQFRRLANFYFLCLAIIHSTIDSPVSPLTSILPLLFVISVTAAKQGYEDWLRHREDDKVNNAPARVVRDGKITEVYRRQISVGQVVEVKEGEEFPCDLLLLTSDDPEAKCDVTTANLDGETNLKTFMCPSETRDLASPGDLWQLRATVQCQLPHANLYDFKGRLEVYQGDATAAQAPLSTENLLLRGARLKNTKHIHGLAVYTGKDTKVALNSKMKSNKFSTVDKTMNYFLVFFLVFMVSEILLCTGLKYSVFSQQVTNSMWYLDYPSDEPITGKLVYQDSVSFLVIFSYIIPVSLYVTLEIQKFLGTMFMQWDEELTGPGEDEAPKVNTSDLNEELGQVQYLFSDKTGTLTENVMNFRQCSVNGARYQEVEGCLMGLNDDTNTLHPLPPRLPEDVVTFLETLALCHTVHISSSSSSSSAAVPEEEVKGEPSEVSEGVVELSDLGPKYHASSPDEMALVEACARYGVVFIGSRENQLTLEVEGTTKTYSRLQVLEFDSDRKCMSVVVREEATGRIWLLTKGAESSVLQRCCPGDSDHQQLLQTTNKHIDDYAMTGLRTLAVGRRQLQEKEYQGFADQLSKARQVVEGREAVVREVTDKMEAELTLLGATGVEDLLQEGVQETLEAFRAAGIKVWVLTGDKVETAVNIAYSCGHFKRFMSILTLTGLKNAEEAQTRVQVYMDESSEDGRMYGLVVDGLSLVFLLDHVKDDFYQLCTRCWAVVCCRMSPSQKAETVRLVKHSKEAPRCTAVGDGANDVSMIQEAHLGLGIMGKEGRQAVRCADFGVAQFRFLRKLLFVHGHWNYVRLATFIQFSFYKNVAFNTPMVFYAIWSAYSTQSVYESLVLTLFNVTCTSLPVLVYGLLEQNLPAALLLARPHLYQRVANNSILSWTRFIKWSCFGFWHAIVMYFGMMAACWDDTCGLPHGQTPDLYLFGLGLGTLCVFVVNIKIVVEANYLTWVFFWSLVITFLGYSAIYLLYSGIPSEPFVRYGIYWAYYRMFESPALNLTFVLLGVTCLLPDLLDKIYTHSTDKELRRGRLVKEAPWKLQLLKMIHHSSRKQNPVNSLPNYEPINLHQHPQLREGARDVGVAEPPVFRDLALCGYLP